MSMTSDPNVLTSRLRQRLETDRQQIKETGERPAEARVAPALVVGLSLFLGISGGSWATMHWLSRSIERRIETLAAVNVQIEQAQETLAEIEETTWGVTLREIDGERFLVLPADTLDYPSWTVGGRPAVKLSRE